MTIVDNHPRNINCLVIIWFMLVPVFLWNQGYICDGSFFLIMYSESEGRSKLYQFSVENLPTQFNPIPLNQNRKLFGLTYNTVDLHLWAIDAEQNEMVRINFYGEVEVMGKIDNLDPDLFYSSGMISPDGKSYFFLGYNKEENQAQKFYEIDLGEPPFFAAYDDISASGASRILDMAVDPVFGTVYGYNNLNGTVVQFGIDGQIATISQSRRDEQGIEALFLDRNAVMYGYTRNGEFYQIDKVEGNLKFLQRGPQGTLVDGCTCPFTYAFEKNINQQVLIPCEPFEVVYSFRNHLGLSQTGIQLRDTFPEGFEILNVTSTIPYTLSPNNPMTNVLALNNMIYLMGANTLRVTVQPPQFFAGTFTSQARQGPFPIALNASHLSDDPRTDILSDPTTGEIVSVLDVALEQFVSFSCDGSEATIQSPVASADNHWSTGSTAPSIEISETGKYVLSIENACFYYKDSTILTAFPDPKQISLGEDLMIDAGQTVTITPVLNRGEIKSLYWTVNGVPESCSECRELVLIPTSNTSIELEAMDSEGCLLNDELLISVEYNTQVYAPNVFTPNGDGINDTFYLSSAVPGSLRLYIYNRWGNLVFESGYTQLSDSNSGWNGFMKGQVLSTGPYLWVAEVEFNNGLRETLSGDVLLISR